MFFFPFFFLLFFIVKKEIGNANPIIFLYCLTKREKGEFVICFYAFVEKKGGGKWSYLHMHSLMSKIWLKFYNNIIFSSYIHHVLARKKFPSCLSLQKSCTYTIPTLHLIDPTSTPLPQPVTPILKVWICLHWCGWEF